MLKRFIFAFFIIVTGYSMSDAAFLRNVPAFLIQPDGDTVKCFESGDEFYRRFHDENDFTIVRNPQTRFWVYADFIGNEVTATSYIVGRTDPLSVALQSGVAITAEEYYSRYERYFANTEIILAPNIGVINNINIFIRFSDETEFPDPRSHYDSLFNNSTFNTSSMRNYFDEVSYGQLTINTHSFPICDPNVNLSYQDTLPRAYYQPFDQIDNPIGYTDDDDKRLREHSLLRSAINFVTPEIPTDLEIDNDFDGFVDAVCFIIRDTTDQWMDLIWPHRWMLNSFDVFIHGIQVYDYAFEIEKRSTVDVYCHETFHVIGAPDLYRYSYAYRNFRSIWEWGLMDDHPDPPSHMGAYMKFQYGGWMDSIPRIVVPGTYTLSPVTSSTNNAYLIPCPNSTNEYFVLEYRRKAGSIFENSLRDPGLLIYRINTDWVGYGNRYGPPDEVYIYRPQGDINTNGRYEDANFSLEEGRTAFNDTTEAVCWVADSTLGGLSISNIGSAGFTISFQLDANEHFLSGEVYDGQFGPLTPEGEGYFITSEVIIPTGQTLTIEPGTTIHWFEGGKITANGILTVDGSTSAVEFIMFDDTTNVKIRVNSMLRMQEGGTFILPN